MTLSDAVIIGGFITLFAVLLGIALAGVVEEPQEDPQD
jgi:uncharacterized membrane protein YeiB